MAALTKTVDGKALPADKFAMVGDPNDISTWHLPIDEQHIDSALDLFGHETHGTADQKSKAARKIASTARAHGIDSDRIKNFESKHCGGEHADFGNGWVEIFRAGSYGDKGNFSADDLDRVISNYDPDHHEAPACIGHPADNLPAYGWASRLMRQGDTLLAKFKEVDPAFESAVKAGRFKKRSAAFYLNSDGKIENLRHVAFLGAQPPEVKGLKNLNFEDNGRKFTQVDFGEEETVAAENEKDFGERFMGWLKSLRPESSTGTFSESDVKRIAQEAANAAAAPLQAKITSLETDLKTQATKFAEREGAIATSETKQRATEAINGLKSKGRWVPAFDKQGVPMVFDELAKITTTVEFGEGSEKKTLTPLQVMVAFFEGMPKIVPDGRVVAMGDRTAPRKSTGDPLTDAAKVRSAEKKISFSEAVDQIVAESPELAIPGGARAGAV